jgi:tol-pal system protein YbgF
MEVTMESRWFRNVLFVAMGFVAFSFSGCGTIQEGTTEEDEWTDSTPISRTAMMEYRLDSLTRENQKLQQQLDQAVTENKNLTSRNTELESKPVGTPSYVPAPSAPIPTRSISNPGYESALSKFRNRNFQDAIDEFSTLLTAGVADDLADNCRYWIGESYFGQKKFGDAIQQFEAVVAIPGSDKADDAQLMIGNSYGAQGNRSAAKQAYQSLISNFPASPLVKRARAKMGGM